MRKKTNKLLNGAAGMIMAVLLGFAAFYAGGFMINNITASAANLIDSGLNYVETLDKVSNPGIGFYKALSYVMQPDRSSLPDSMNQKALKEYQGEFSLLHLQFGLEACSENAKYERGGVYESGVSRNVTQPMLDVLDGVMNLCREMGFTTIVRFCYNVYGISPAMAGVTQSGQNTYLNAEPSIDWMIRHIQQLKPFFTKHSDIIESVDVGMLGPWGEMHSTSAASGSAGRSNTFQIINALLDAVPENRAVTIRYPQQFTYWYNDKYQTEYSDLQIGNIDIKEGTPEYRIGMFNDGYLGSSTDLGSFRGGRASESIWINKASRHITYGGEVVSNNGVTSGDGIGDYNRIEFIAWEGFYTHTSHLNIDWNYQFVISQWKETPYRTAALSNSYPTAGLRARTEARYSNAQAKAFTYVQNRLGYRLVLREAKHSASVSSGGKMTFAGKIQNVGFGNMINEKKAQVILAKKDGTKVFRQEVDLNLKDWLAAESGHGGYANTVDFGFEIDMKESGVNYADGVYDIYLRIYNSDEKIKDSNMRTVRFANDDIWNADLGANYIGTVRSGSSYVVTFKNIDGTKLDDADTVSGGSVVYKGPTPISPNRTVSIDYEFTGWNISLDNINEDKIATVIYKQVVRKYIVSFIDRDGNLIATQKFEYESVLNTSQLLNTAPTCYEGIYKYVFDGWSGFDPGITKVLGDIEINATYTQSYREYTIKFNLNGGTLVSGELEHEITYMQSATAPIVKREGYIFIGWTDSIDYWVATGDCEVSAIWLKEYETEPDDGKNGCGAKLLAENPGGGLIISGVFIAVLSAAIIFFKKRNVF